MLHPTWLLPVLLIACTPRATEPEPQLVSAIVEMHLLDARASVVEDVPESTRVQLLGRHGFTPASFREALEALARRPEDYEAAMAAVNESLATRLRTLPAPSITPPAMMPPAEAVPPTLPPPR
ncbi:MAG TPA: hypothetical protein VD948_13130 [Rhodothermales bacterium]|nr:hypothetical protein [Rhodothermales bacterium]